MYYWRVLGCTAGRVLGCTAGGCLGCTARVRVTVLLGVLLLGCRVYCCRGVLGCTAGRC